MRTCLYASFFVLYGEANRTFTRIFACKNAITPVVSEEILQSYERRLWRFKSFYPHQKYGDELLVRLHIFRFGYGSQNLPNARGVGSRQRLAVCGSK